MFNLGGFEWIIILVIVVLIFGIGRVGKIGGELGNAIRQFREGLGDDKKDAGGKKDDEKPKSDPPQA